MVRKPFNQSLRRSCLPVLGDVEAPFEGEMDVLVIINEGRCSSVVTTSHQSGWGILIGDFSVLAFDLLENIRVTYSASRREESCRCLVRTNPVVLLRKVWGARWEVWGKVRTYQHLLVLRDADALALDGLDVVQAGEDLVLDLELRGHVELGTFLDLQASVSTARKRGFIRRSSVL